MSRISNDTKTRAPTSTEGTNRTDGSQQSQRSQQGEDAPSLDELAGRSRLGEDVDIPRVELKGIDVGPSLFGGLPSLPEDSSLSLPYDAVGASFDLVREQSLAEVHGHVYAMRALAAGASEGDAQCVQRAAGVVEDGAERARDLPVGDGIALVEERLVDARGHVDEVTDPKLQESERGTLAAIGDTLKRARDAVSAQWLEATSFVKQPKPGETFEIGTERGAKHNAVQVTSAESLSIARERDATGGPGAFVVEHTEKVGGGIGLSTPETAGRGLSAGGELSVTVGGSIKVAYAAETFADARAIVGKELAKEALGTAANAVVGPAGSALVKLATFDTRQVRSIELTGGAAFEAAAKLGIPVAAVEGKFGTSTSLSLTLRFEKGEVTKAELKGRAQVELAGAIGVGDERSDPVSNDHRRAGGASMQGGQILGALEIKQTFDLKGDALKKLSDEPGDAPAPVAQESATSVSLIVEGLLNHSSRKATLDFPGEKAADAAALVLAKGPTAALEQLADVDATLTIEESHRVQTTVGGTVGSGSAGELTTRGHFAYSASIPPVVEHGDLGALVGKLLTDSPPRDKALDDQVLANRAVR